MPNKKGLTVSEVEKCAKVLAIALVDTNAGEVKITLEAFSFRGSKPKDIEVIARNKK